MVYGLVKTSMLNKKGIKIFLRNVKIITVIMILFIIVIVYFI